MSNKKRHSFGLSKSRLMRGLQCEKCLYLTIHHPELEPPIDAVQQVIFDQGHAVGKLAQKEFPGGVEITAPYYDTTEAVRQTTIAMQNGAKAIYEATFFQDDTVVKVDILHRKNLKAPWEVVEVKSTTSVKSEHLSDLAIQVRILELAGMKLKTISLMHLNPLSTAPELKNLFKATNVSKEVQSIKTQLPQKISELKKLLTQPEPPTTDIGPHCFEPYDCPFIDHCWKHVPPRSIFDFPQLGAKKWKFYEQRIIDLNDSKFGPFEGINAKRLEAIRCNKRWVDTSSITEAMKTWKWPLLHLDFETIGFAIPKYDGTCPYQQVPFQFSAMVQEKMGGPLEHVQFLHEEQSDPRPFLVEALAKVLKRGKSIVAYNKGFESGKISKLAEAFPKQSKILLAACDRLVDPLPIFRNAVYDPAFGDSFSIKSVAPAILGKSASYDGMVVSDGTAAQLSFIELINPHTSPTRKAELRSAMLAYCKKDTEVMARLVDWLVNLVHS